MTLRSIYGHDALTDRLEATIASGRFPQVALFVGPAGVGKQRLALWVGQALLCDEGPGKPCGQCGSCRQVDALSHPDVHWFVPVVKKGSAGDAEKQIEATLEALAEIMQERRNAPLYLPPDPRASHALASVRLLHRRTAVTPFQGRRKIIVLGDAERLVVQESSQEAANALLKVLEEPPTDTTLILTAAQPQRLLPTIRSRCVPLRIRRITDDAVRDFVKREMTSTKSRANLDQLVALAEGRIGRVLTKAESGDEAARAAERFISAVRNGPHAWSERVLLQPPWDARGGFTAMLDALAMHLRGNLEEAARRGDRGVRRQLEAVAKVETFRSEAQGNVNPQVALAVLASEVDGLI
jgi:DNA polymerase-3 subunit delta'